MKFFGLYKNTQVFKIALIVAIVVIGYIASVFYTQMQKLDTSVELIASSNKTQYELEKLLSIMGNYEMSLRNYIITQNEVYLEDRFLNRGEIEACIKNLKKIAGNDSAKIKDIDSLKKLIDYRFKLFRDLLLIQKSPRKNTSELYIKLLESSSCTESMHAFVYKRINAEISKIKRYNTNHQFELNDSIISAFLLVLLSLLILLLSFNKMNVDINELKKTNDELKFTNLSFKNAEQIAGFGHWKYNLVKNTYTFSDNFYRLMGVEPRAFEPSLENVGKFLHPDDYNSVMEVHKQSLIDHQPTSIMLRYLLQDGTVKYIMSVGSFTRNSNGDLVKIGVNYDITAQYKKTLEIEESNKQLKTINAELESFNNIVSHDLQEPLRKIQMFVSRLEEKEIDLLTPNGKEYFVKIRLAANKMQTLLIDLLNYSRVAKGDKIFVKLNLKDLVEQCIQDLSVDIEEKKAEIEVMDLPEINGIGFQMEQLFVNLISNSLKYSKENIPPKISIKSEKISGKEMYNSKIISNTDYHKIVVSDNGIGFKQEYADKVFQLFKRLETDSKYTGTGIGLAICKKIMENHNGFIKVKSRPSVGTKFSLFFPK
ncbi:ATP-binding protein [Flavobacterium aquariorum]|nr:ATP-binding protein [Flavobacterium aquariorum]